jgi:hypothetical protein
MQHTIESIRESARTGTVNGYYGQPVRSAVVVVGPVRVTCNYVKSASADRQYDEYTWVVNDMLRDEAFVHRLLADAWRRTDYVEPGNGAPIVG